MQSSWVPASLTPERKHSRLDGKPGPVEGQRPPQQAKLSLLLFFMQSWLMIIWEPPAYSPTFHCPIFLAQMINHNSHYKYSISTCYVPDTILPRVQLWKISRGASHCTHYPCLPVRKVLSFSFAAEANEVKKSSGACPGSTTKWVSKQGCLLRPGLPITQPGRLLGQRVEFTKLLWSSLNKLHFLNFSGLIGT